MKNVKRILNLCLAVKVVKKTMIERFKTIMQAFFGDWLSVILFLTGVILLSVAAFAVNLIVGILVSGILLIVMACLLDKERG